MKATRLRVGQIILLVLIVINLLFIYGQSLVPQKQSGELSDAVGEAVGDTVEDVVAPITPPGFNIGDFIKRNIRKLAHFAEFASLGVLVALYITHYARNTLYTLISYPAALIAALFDETIQFFSGRGDSIFDVWLDFSGYLTAYILTTGIFFAVIKIISAIKNKKTEKTEQNG